MSDNERSTLEEFYSEDESIQGLNLNSDSDVSDDDNFISSIKKVSDNQKQQRIEEELGEKKDVKEEILNEQFESLNGADIDQLNVQKNSDSEIKETENEGEEEKEVEEEEEEKGEEEKEVEEEEEEKGEEEKGEEEKEEEEKEEEKKEEEKKEEEKKEEEKKEEEIEKEKQQQEEIEKEKQQEEDKDKDIQEEDKEQEKEEENKEQEQHEKEQKQQENDKDEKKQEVLIDSVSHKTSDDKSDSEAVHKSGTEQEVEEFLEIEENKRSPENSNGIISPDVSPTVSEATTDNIAPTLPARGVEANMTKVMPSLPPRRVSSISSNPFEKHDREVELKSQGGSPKKSSLIQITTPTENNFPKKHAVPPSLKEELNNPKFLRNLQIIATSEDKEEIHADTRKSSAKIDISDKIDIIRENSKAVSKDFDLIVNRFQLNNKMRDVSDSGIKSDDTLKEDFKKVYDEDISNEHLGDEQKEKLQFWNELITDYDRVIKQYPDKLERMIFNDGIPSDLRPFLWKFITQSNLKNLQNLYASNVKIESSHKAQIEKDIMRTSFIPKEKEEMLKNVCLAYSNYDSDLGYTQGLCFIVTPILLTLESEEETFSLLVKLMHDYDLRSFYTQDMPGLMLKLYQFDKLLQEFSPQVYAHLGQCGIISNMFVSQWFLSFFGYRFPYEFVIRIFDIILLEGLEALLKFALAAITKNEDKILSLQFDDLLEFLKGDLFNIYLANQENDKKNSDIEEDKYNVTEFVHEAQGIKLMPISLDTIKQEYLEISELKKSFNPLDKEISRLKIINKNQCDELLKVKSSFNVLKKDHELIANELINKRQNILELTDMLDEKDSELNQWKKKYEESLKNSQLDNPDSQIPTDLKEGLEQVLESNRKVMERNMELEHENESLKALVKNLEHSLMEQGSSAKEGSKWKLFKK